MAIAGLDGDNKSTARDLVRVTCVVAAKSDAAKAAKSLSGRIIIDPHALPEFHLDSSYFLGEFVRSMHLDREKPSAEQLEGLLGVAPTEERLSRYARE